MVNVYRRCAHSSGEWCVKVARVPDRNPVAAIALRNEAADKRKLRRALGIDGARTLLGVRGSRRLFWANQLWTGLGVSEVRAFQGCHPHLRGERACVRLRAEIRKLPGLRHPERDTDGATGTDDAAACRGLASRLASTHGISRLRVARTGTQTETLSKDRSDVSGSEDNGLQQFPSGGKLGATGFEPATSCSQSGSRHPPNDSKNTCFIESTPHSHLLQVVAKNSGSKRGIAVAGDEKR